MYKSLAINPADVDERVQALLDRGLGVAVCENATRVDLTNTIDDEADVQNSGEEEYHPPNVQQQRAALEPIGDIQAHLQKAALTKKDRINLAKAKAMQEAVAWIDATSTTNADNLAVGHEDEDFPQQPDEPDEPEVNPKRPRRSSCNKQVVVFFRCGRTSLERYSK